MRRLSVFALLLSGCFVPSLGALESASPGTCDTEHSCAPGYTCIEDICQANADLSCEPGAQVVCGRNAGECQRGVATCTTDGRFGPCEGEIIAVTEVCNGKDDDCDGVSDEEARTSLCGLQLGVCAGKVQACGNGQVEAECTASSYGADYQPAETRCDGLDNDCDGDTDEALTQACANQQGTCAGAVQQCSGGTFAPCTQEDYQAHSTAYQAFERTCDGQDNDCDGQLDAWAPFNLSNPAVESAPDTARSRNVAAIALPQESSGQSPSLLTLYEEEGFIRPRAFYADGRVSQGRFPSATVPQSFKATQPVLASNGRLHLGAWIEELPPPRGTVTHRVMVARLGADGVSTLPEQAAIPVFDQGRPVRLALTMSEDRALVVVEQAQEPAGPKLWAVTMPLSFPLQSGSIRTQLLTADTAGTRPSVFPARSSSETFFVAYESASGIRVASVRDDATVSTLAGIDVVGASQPQIFSEEASGGVQGYTLYFVPPSKDRIAVSQCTNSSCGPQTDLVPGPLTGPIEDLRIASRSPMSQELLVATWVSGGTVQVFLPGAGAGGAPMRAHSAGTAFRPFPVVLDSGIADGGKAFVLFDTEGNTAGGLARDEIFLLPVCLP